MYASRKEGATGTSKRRRSGDTSRYLDPITKRRWALGSIFADTRTLTDRGRPRQEGHCYLRPRPAPGRLAQVSAAVRLNLLSPSTIPRTVIDASPSLTRELEKKFSDRHILIVASRRILPRPKRSNRSHTTLKQKRPRSRTLTAVHDAILTDLVYPVEIVGKRVRTREDGSKILKVVLDEKERGGVDYRLDTYSEVYKRLTGKGVNFEFPQQGSDYPGM